MLSAFELSWSVDFILYFTVVYPVALWEETEDTPKLLQI